MTTPTRRRTLRAHKLPTCLATGKIRYRDKHQAHEGLKIAKRARQRDDYLGIESRRREVRVYQCTDCGGWHITSQAARNASSPRLTAA